MNTDLEFIQQLQNFLGRVCGMATVAPYFKKKDGTVDREKTLALPCYEGFGK